MLLEEALEELNKVSDSPSLLDVGCGSGILGIAGIKLGAGPVLAVDNDPVAVEAAAKNALLNKVNDKLQLRCAPVKELGGRYDIVIANLDPMTLAANRDKLVSLAGRFLIVSGVPSGPVGRNTKPVCQPGPCPRRERSWIQSGDAACSVEVMNGARLERKKVCAQALKIDSSTTAVEWSWS